MNQKQTSIKCYDSIARWTTAKLDTHKQEDKQRANKLLQSHEKNFASVYKIILVSIVKSSFIRGDAHLL